MKLRNTRSTNIFKLSAPCLLVGAALGGFSMNAQSSSLTLENCGGRTAAECEAYKREQARRAQQTVDNYGGGETSCDMGQVHEELIDRFKLPEIPSSLEDCGIGGFLNFDFSFGLGDFDFSSLFCDFAQDVVGNFQENMSVDFDIGMNGISIDSPIYSLQTKGADQAVDELLYGATGVEQNGRGILGDASDAYRGTLSKVKRTFSDNGYTPGGAARNSFQDAADRVRNNSSVNLEDVRRNIEAIQEVETTGTNNTQPGNTTFRTPAGGRVTIGGDMSGRIEADGYSEEQISRFNNIPYSQLNSLNERELAEYLELSPEQRKREGIEVPPTPNTRQPQYNSNGRRDPSIKEPIYRGEPVQQKPIFNINPPVEDREETQQDPSKRLQELLFNRDREKR